MKGKYKNLQGEIIDILQHDEANKIVYVRTVEGESKWISTEDSKWWQSLEVQPEVVAVVEKAPEPIAEPIVVVEEVKEEVKVEPIIEVKKEPVKEPVFVKPIETKPTFQKHKGKNK
tara:strand:- start:451 stop:798 length:348 start_codon:yes stop_codon:yes gene_type:complete